MVVVVIFLYVLAAVLPFLGLFGIFRAARAEARERRETVANREGESAGPTFADFDVMILRAWGMPEEALKHAKRDLWLIGLGLSCGAAASIWSLFLR